MSTKRILFPTDFSHMSDAALDFATSLASDMDAKLIIVHVEEPPRAYGGGEMYYGIIDPPTKELKRMLLDVLPSNSEIAYEHRLVSGSPARSVIDLANQEGVDLIVMGTHGRTGLSRVLMGSVAEEIVRRAPCPVLTYKHPSKTLAGAS